MNLTKHTDVDAVAQQTWRRRLAIYIFSAGVVCLPMSIPVMSWDSGLSEQIRLGHVPGDLRKAIELSEAFAHGSGVTVILLALLLCTRPPRNGVWLAVATTAASGITANLLKAIFTRARPYTYDAVDAASQANRSDVTGWQFLGSGSFWDASQRSFPSGHTATAWGLAFGLCLLFPRASWLFIFLAGLATFQRLYSGAHFPSDAIAGFGVACVMSGIVLWWASRTPQQDATRLRG